jgi:hypothetical protein
MLFLIEKPAKIAWGCDNLPISIAKTLLRMGFNLQQELVIVSAVPAHVYMRMNALTWGNSGEKHPTKFVSADQRHDAAGVGFNGGD